MTGTITAKVSADHGDTWTLDGLGNWTGTNVVVTDGGSQSRSVNNRELEARAA